MDLLIAPDKFKGCLTAPEAARLMAAGVRRARPGVRVRLMPLADGGDGTGAVLAAALGGRRRSARVRDAAGRPARAEWIWFPRTRTALVELAQSSGLWRLPPRLRDPLRTSTYGTGQAIRAALKLKPRALWVAAGGSATVDGGAGLLQALGARLFLRGGAELLRPAVGGDLSSLGSVDLSGLARLPPVKVLCDVNNPLLGKRGAAPAFGPQKGASPRDVVRLEAGLRRWAGILEEASKRKIGGRPRMGAAGGAAAGLAAAYGARLESGADVVLRAVGMDAALKEAAAVMTGEGRVDRTTFEGKAVGELWRRARVPVLFLAGGIGDGVEKRLRRRDRAAVMAPGLSVQGSIRGARRLLPAAAERLAREAIP